MVFSLFAKMICCSAGCRPFLPIGKLWALNAGPFPEGNYLYHSSSDFATDRSFLFLTVAAEDVEPEKTPSTGAGTLTSDSSLH
jgi:hypothetical protein